MGFASTVTKKTVFGDMRVHFGNYTNGAADTGGTIDTGLLSVEHITAQGTSGSTSALITTSLPTADGNVAISTAADADGLWMAYGK